jgi:hypothetical protein
MSVTSYQTLGLNPTEDSAVVQDPDGEGKIVYLFLPLYKVRRCNVIYFKPHTLPYSAETCKMLSTHTRSTAPTSPKKRWSSSLKGHAKLSAPCTIIEPQSVLNPARTHKPHRVRTPVGFLENSNLIISHNPNTIQMTKMTKGSLNPMVTKREDTLTIIRARSLSLTSSRVRKVEVRVGRKRVG